MKHYNYVVIYCNPDGDHGMSFYTAAELTKKLNEDWWGENPRIAKIEDVDRNDLGSFEGLIIIEGQLVQPKPVNVVKEWKL